MAYGVVHTFAGGHRGSVRGIDCRCPSRMDGLPEGQVFHAAGPSDDGWTIVAIHESKESWEAFRDGTLMPPHATGHRRRLSPPRPKRPPSRSATSSHKAILEPRLAPRDHVPRCGFHKKHDGGVTVGDPRPTTCQVSNLASDSTATVVASSISAPCMVFDARCVEHGHSAGDFGLEFTLCACWSLRRDEGQRDSDECVGIAVEQVPVYRVAHLGAILEPDYAVLHEEERVGRCDERIGRSVVRYPAPRPRARPSPARSRRCRRRVMREQECRTGRGRAWWTPSVVVAAVGGRRVEERSSGRVPDLRGDRPGQPHGTSSRRTTGAQECPRRGEADLAGAEMSFGCFASLCRRRFVRAEKGCCLVTDRPVGDVLEGYAIAMREAA